MSRLLLARMAQVTAPTVQGVIGLEQSDAPARRTVAGDEHVAGAVCMANGDGGYDLELFVVARAVPLEPLAARLRTAVLAEAAAGGLGEQLHEVHVVISDVVEEES